MTVEDCHWHFSEFEKDGQVPKFHPVTRLLWPTAQRAAPYEKIAEQTAEKNSLRWSP
jgi:hypothetical protein